MMRITRLALATALLGSLAPAAALAQDCASGPVTVGFLPKLDTDPYFQVAKTGADEAQKEIGGTVIQQAPSQATAEAQIEFINNLVSQQVKVIAISGNDANAVAPALKRAMAQGIRVVSYDSDVAPAARTLFLNQAKGDSLAEMMLESMAQLIGGEGEFAILSSTPTATNQNAWIDFMKAKLKEPKYAKMKLVQIAYGEESEQVNQQQALALVEALRAVANRLGATVAQIAIAWVTSRGEDIFPLIGARKRSQLAESLGALDVRLSSADLAAIEKAVPKNAAKGGRYQEAQMAHLDSER